MSGNNVTTISGGLILNPLSGQSISLTSSGAGAMALNSATSFAINASSTVSIDSTGGVLNFGNNADAQNINIGTGAAARVITIGNGTGGTNLILNSGTGGIDIGRNAVAQTIRIGNTTGATSVYIDSGTGNIDIGTSTAKTIRIGNTTGASALALNSGTGNTVITAPTLNLAASTNLQINGTNGVSVACTGGLGSAPTALTTTKGIVTAQTCGTSDQRLKKNIESYDNNVLDRISKVRAVTYEFNDLYYQITGMPLETKDPTHYGFIAQELQQQFPELITTAFDGMDYLAIGERAIPAVLWEGLRELNQGFVEYKETTNNKIANLENLVNNFNFSMPTEFNFVPLFNKDTAGFAVIRSGDKKVKVEFDKEYSVEPVVTADISFESGDNMDQTNLDTLFAYQIQHFIIEKDKTGFTILLNKSAPRDMRFSWVAIAVKDVTTTISISPGLILDETQPVDDSAPTEDRVETGIVDEAAATSTEETVTEEVVEEPVVPEVPVDTSATSSDDVIILPDPQE